MKLMTPRHFVVCLTLLCSVAVWGQNQSNKIDSTGNIGIGVTNPSNKLEVNGKARLDSTLEVRDSAVFRKRVHIEEDVIVHGKTFMRDNGVANQNFRVQNGFNVDGISHFHDNVFVDSTFRVETLGLFNGNVRVNGQLRTYGINNLFGISRFHDEVRLLNLNDTSGQNQDAFMMLSGNGLIQRKDLATVNSIDTLSYVLTLNSSGDVEKIPTKDFMQGSFEYEPLLCRMDQYGNTYPYWKSQPDEMILECGVRVGIGTDNPQEELHIRRSNASILLEDSGDRFSFQASNGYGRIINDGSVSIFLDSDNDENNAVFRINSNSDHFSGSENDILRVYESGKLTIKSAQTGDKILQLETDGMLRAREIMVDLVAWPDYVFEKEYKLLSTDELRSYIDKHQHLPNVPSAKEVEEKGVGLGEMNKKLLEKVEELTLYMLQQQEEIEAFKAEMEAMKEEGGQ